MNNKNIGLKIKEIRGRQSLITGAKITQQVLADKIGTSRSYIGDIESGRVVPSTKMLSMICSALDANIEEFYEQKKQLIEINYDDCSYLSVKESDSPIYGQLKKPLNINSIKLVSNFIENLVESGIIKDPNNIDESTEKLILEIVKKEVEAILNKRNS